MDLGAHPGQGPRLLHGLRPRRAGPGSSPAFTTWSSAASAGPSAKGEVFDSRARVAAGLPPFTFAESPAEIPNYLPGQPVGHAGRADPHDAEPARAGRVDARTWFCPPGSSRSSSPPSPRSPSRSAWPGTTAAGSGSPRASTIPTPSSRDGQGRDRITICEDTDGDGRADKFTVFAEGLNIPTSLLCARRRRDRAAGARHALPQGHRRRRQGRRAQGALHRLGHRRHARRAEQPALGLRQLGLGHRRLLGISRHGRRRGRTRSARASTASSPTARSSSSCAARTTTPGASASARRGWSSARRPTAARASTCRSPTAITRRCAAGRRQAREHRGDATSSTRSPSRCGRSTFTAASPRRPATRSTPRAPIRPITGTRRRSSPSRPATWSPRSRSTARGATSPTTTAGTCWPATTNGPRRSRPRSGPTATSGSSTGTTTSSSTTRRRTASRPAGATPTKRRLRDKTHGRIYRIVYKDAAAPSLTLLSIRNDASRPGRRARRRQSALADARPAAAGRARQDGRRARADRARRAISRSMRSA